MHTIGAAIHFSMVMLSCIGDVLCTAVDGAMYGDSFRASQGLNLCKPLTRLLGSDGLSTTRARKCHISSGLALVGSHRGMMHVCRVCERAYFRYITIALDGK